MPSTSFVPLVADPLPPPGRPFEAVLRPFLVDLFEAYPVWAGAIGYHLGDGTWDDRSEDGRRGWLARLARHEAAAAALADDALDPDERVDRALLLEGLERLRFDEEVLREDAWDPMATVSLLGSGLFGLLAREYAPWEHRGGAFLARLEGLPAMLDAAAAALTGLPGRPVSLLHLDTALRQLPGIDGLIEGGLVEAGRRAAAGEAPGVAAAMDRAAAAARAALATFRSRLDGSIRARAEGDGRLGSELYARKLRLTLGSDLAPDRLLERAWADHRAIRAEMLRLATRLWPAWLPGEPLPAVAPGDVKGEGELVRRVLDAIAAEHQQPDDLIDWCTSEIARIEAFCRDHDVIGLAEEPLRIAWTPVYMRAYGRAFLDAPGPLDRGESSHFFITPPDEDAPAEAVESYLREENDRALRLLCIHEGVPGHYLQLARSNRSPSLMRTIFSNGMFAEGWAVYIEQVMLDLGYGAEDPALQLSHWKLYLRAVTNAILDVETHARGMTKEAAMDLMVRQSFQEEDEAEAKWLRARLTSTQLSTYYVGALEMFDLEQESRLRAAEVAGAGPGAVPPRLIGTPPGPTPGFDCRAHLEAVIAHGTPPIHWVRHILRSTPAIPPAPAGDDRPNATASARAASALLDSPR